MTPKTRNGPVEQMRVLLVGRRSARTHRIQTLNQLRHLVFTGPEPIQVRFKDRHKTGLVTEAAAMRPRKGSDPVAFTTNTVIRDLARRIQGLNAEMASIDAALIELVAATAPSLLELPWRRPRQRRNAARHRRRHRLDVRHQALSGLAERDWSGLAVGSRTCASMTCFEWSIHQSTEIALCCALTSSMIFVEAPSRGQRTSTLLRSWRDSYTTTILFGTSGGETLNENEMRTAPRTLKALLDRLGIGHEIEWRDYESFKSYWRRHGAHGSWQARRGLLNEVFEPLFNEFEKLEDSLLSGSLAEPVSPPQATGWTQVDAEIRELRRRFRTASTPQDYRSVGTHCVGVLEALSRNVYDPALHLRDGETEPPADKTKQRIGRFVEDALPGRDNAPLRGLVTKTIDLAQSVKHRQTPTRRDAGIAADAVILLANILKRLEPEQ